MALQSLTSLQGLDNIATCTGVVVWEVQLENLNGLNSLTALETYLDIRHNKHLKTFDGMESITSIGGDIFIEDNAALASIQSLGSVTTFQGGLMLKGVAANAVGIPCSVTPSWLDVDGSLCASLHPATWECICGRGEDQYVEEASRIKNQFGWDILLLFQSSLCCFLFLMRTVHRRSRSSKSQL